MSRTVLLPIYKLWPKIKPYVIPHKKLVLLSLVIVPVLSAANLIQPYLMKIAIDDHIMKKDMNGLRGIGLLFLGMFLAEYILNFMQVYILQLTGQKVIFALRRDLFTKIQNLDARFLEKTPVGVILTRLTGDCEGISELFASGVVSLGWDFFRLAMTVVAMVWLDWRLTLVSLSVVPILVISVFIFRTLLQKGYNLVRERWADLTVFVQEHLAGMKIVQLFRREAQSSADFKEINHAYRDAVMSTVVYDAFLYALVEALASIAVGLMIWYGGGSLVQKTVSFGVLVAFIEYIQRFFIPIRDLSAKFAIIQAAQVAMNRIFGLLDEKITIQTPAVAQPLPKGGFVQGIAFEKVGFSYLPEKPVLEDINLQIRPGQRVALVGVTGSGKSTLMKLLNRTYDVKEGRILIDGVALGDYPLQGVRGLFAVVPQNVFLFSGSLLENIRLFNSKFTQEQVVEAARQAGAHEFIVRLPRQYDHDIRERGGNLSMGQRQLVAMARAVLYDAPVLLLDEATAHVDPLTTRLLQKGLAEVSKHRTVVVAAHRLDTVKSADQIIVIHHGKIKESGNHQELLQWGGLYAQLCRFDLVA